MDTIELNGIVLSSSSQGETDRRLVILTREMGRITVFARGAARPKSTLVAVARPFVTARFTVYPRRDSYSLHSAEVKESFDGLSADYDKMVYACYFCELAGYFSMEQAESSDLVNLLFVSLRALERGKIPGLLIRCIYEFRLFYDSGEYPPVLSCAECGKPFREGIFLMSSKKALCPACADGQDGDHLPASVVYALQFVYTVPVTKLYSFTLTQEAMDILFAFLKRWRRRILDRTFRSEPMLPENAPTFADS